LLLFDTKLLNFKHVKGKCNSVSQTSRATKVLSMKRKLIPLLVTFIFS